MTLNKALAITAIALFAVIAFATAAAFMTGRAKPGSGLRDADPPSEKVSSLRISADGKIAAGQKDGVPLASFTGLGQVRTATAPGADGADGITVVAVPWLAYIAGDTAFYEELSRKGGVLKGIMTDYLSSRTAQELRKDGEAKVKAALLEALNRQLVLGKIQAVYFTDYMFIE